MKKADFEDLLRGMEEAEYDTVCTKGEEYTHGNDDRLASFKEAAVFAGMRPTQVCMVYLTKHFQALADYVATGKTKSDETVYSRIMDLRVYLALMRALVQEEYEARPSGKPA